MNAPAEDVETVLGKLTSMHNAEAKEGQACGAMAVRQQQIEKNAQFHN